MEIADHLTCLLRYLYAVQEETELDLKQQTGSKLERSTSSLYTVTIFFTLYAEYIMWNTGLDEAQAGIRLLGEISITSYMQMMPLLWQKVKRN